MRLISRQIVSPHATELYLTATPDTSADAAAEAGRMFAAVEREAAQKGARILRQRVFVREGCEEAYRQAWAAAGHGPLDRWCNWLQAGPTAPGGVQAHAIRGPGTWNPLRDESGAAVGWACRNETTRWALASGLCVPRSGDDVAATRDAFLTAEKVLAQADLGLGDVARTWFFLESILSWYGQFNKGRNEIFRARGLLSPGPGGGPNVPASTGIGVGPSGGERLAMELFAAAGREGCIVRRPAAGKQRSAYEYGSAFARVADAASPAGRTVFVSGTAAIDPEGRTCFLGDPAGQIRMTLDNVLAVLADEGCSAGDVVEAIAYCKTPAIAALFAERFQATLAWPWVTAVCDVCRDDLLFEVEVTAARAK